MVIYLKNPSMKLYPTLHEYTSGTDMEVNKKKNRVKSKYLGD